MRASAHAGDVSAVCAHNGCVYVGTSHGELLEYQLWETTLTQRPFDTESTPRNAVSCVTAHDDKVLTGEITGDVRVWDAPSATCVHVLQGHNRPVTRILHSDDDVWFTVASEAIRRWDFRVIKDGELVEH